ncbi:MAG: 5-(carboxyamino)imidazole ribonucleotide mutase [Parcubacteria group bacterium]|jgi:phosphoribosylaminoimidazole carboxylase PurE protein
MTELQILVGIIMGSFSDRRLMYGAKAVLEKFLIPYDYHICSAHRTPDDIPPIINEWKGRGCKVLIVGAGWAAHLAGAVAAQTILPVIGVPLSSSVLKGLDSLLATVQMPPGIPVATVAIDCSENAAHLAIQMLAISNDKLAMELRAHRIATMGEDVRDKDRKLRASGWPDETKS